MAIALAIEKVADTWKELEALAHQEHMEMEEGERPFKPDWNSMIQLEKVGTFRVLTARRNGEMVGYFTWMMDFDIESRGTLIVHQCAWFVKKGQFGIAARMFDWAVEEFKRLNVQFVYLHNSMRGRGQTLGKFFERKGAKIKSQTYVLDLRKRPC